MKEEYMNPEIEIISLNLDDIITKSGEGNEQQDEMDKNWTPFEPF